MESKVQGIPEEFAQTGHCVYKLYGGNGELLYIGMTSNLAARMDSHRRSKEWIGDVASFGLIECSSANEAAGEEAALIRELRPKHNIVIPSLRSPRKVEGNESERATYAASTRTEDSLRREIRRRILRVLRGETAYEVAKEEGVSRQSLYRQVAEAKKRRTDELAYWSEVERLVNAPR